MAYKEIQRSGGALGASRTVQDPAKVAPLAELAPWKVVDLPVRPFEGFWSFNPSIHFDGETWRCVLRCADYAMPNGVQIRSETAKPMYARTKNALVVLDPKTWRAANAYPMRELDDYPRKAASHTGFEDLRIFRTGDGKLRGIAASLQLAQGPGDPPPPRHPEQVLLELDDDYNIAAARPIRGPWTSQAQKNWVPFDGADEPRFLYSIERGIVFDDRGPISGWPEGPAPIDPRPKGAAHGGTEVVIRRKAIAVNSGRTGGKLAYGELRGGSQLQYLSDGRWLGIAHDMRFVQGRKWYWHMFYACDENGKLLARSAPFKLCEAGIEFAAGLAFEGDRAVISFGIDDMTCHLGLTSLDAIQSMLVPLEVLA